MLILDNYGEMETVKTEETVVTFSRGFIGIAPCLHPAWSAPPTQAGGGGGA